jgi:outer membrane protein assembly factor BamB
VAAAAAVATAALGVTTAALGVTAAALGVTATAVGVTAVAVDSPCGGRAETASPVLLLPARPGPAFTTDVLWERTVTTTGGALLSGVVADLDGDGRHEVLLHSGRRNDPSHVVALDGAGGRELWRAAFPGRSCVVAGDLNGDGAAEVVVACGAELSVLDGATGERVFGTALRSTIGDLVCARGNIVYTAGKKRDDVMVVLSGDDLRELWVRDAESGRGPFARGFTHPSVWDVDGDGRDEVFVAENGNRLLCLSGDGELLWDVGLGKCERLNPSGVVSSVPVVADLDGDGIAELAVGCFGGAVVVMDALTGEVFDRFQFGVESHETHLSNERIPRFIRDALSKTGEPVNCLTVVELDGSAGCELVLGCSDGFLYACDPGSGDVMWRFDTLESVYDPCLLVGVAGEGTEDAEDDASVAVAAVDTAGDGTHDLLAWDVEGVYLLDGRTGLARAGFADVAGAAGLMACSLNGTTTPALVHIAAERPRVTAWSFASSSATSPSGSVNEAADQDAP